MTRCLSWRQPHGWDAVSKSPKYYFLSGTQPIQLYKFVCTIPTQNININLHSKPPFNRLLRHTRAKAVVYIYILSVYSPFSDRVGYI